MKESKYNISVEYKGNWLVYNLLKSTCVILDCDEYHRFKDCRSFEGSKQLHKMGFYVDKDYNEIKEALYYIRRNTDQRNQNLRRHRIYTTLACNARCPYCFETRADGGHMSLEIAEKVSQYIQKKQGNAQKLTIIWFGGEPLLNTAAIDFISRDLCSSMSSNLNYSYFMITNGLLFNDTLVQKAVHEWKLEGAQITLDGLKDTYEKVKGYNIPNAFDKVIKNIRLLLYNGIKVRIRVNYDQNNFNEILALIDFLGSNFCDCDGIFVYGHKIMSDKSPDNSKLASADDDILIWDKIRENGFCKDILETIKPNLMSCTAGSLYNEMFLPNGNIGKCAQAIAKGDIVGSLETGIHNNKVSKWCCGLLNDVCMECTLLPICGGGCMYELFQGKNGCFVSEKLLKHKLRCYLKSYFFKNA